MHARHSKCFWNRYNVAWPLTRQPEKCWHQLCAAPVSRYDVTQYHSTCRCDGGNTSAADVGDAYSRPGGCYRHIVVEVAIFFVKEETRRNTINTCRLYICSAQYASNDRESLKPHYTPPSTTVHMELRCLPFCLHNLLFGFETNNVWVHELIS